MNFLTKEHLNFCNECLHHSKSQDCYHQALFYTLGVCPDTQSHIHDIFDFKEDCIKVEVLDHGWQTSGSEKVCLMAFNLWNGFYKDGETSPDYLFNCEYAPYFYEATQIRFEHISLSKATQYKGYTR